MFLRNRGFPHSDTCFVCTKVNKNGVVKLCVCMYPSRISNPSASDLWCGPLPVCVLLSVHPTELVV